MWWWSRSSTAPVDIALNWHDCRRLTFPITISVIEAHHFQIIFCINFPNVAKIIPSSLLWSPSRISGANEFACLVFGLCGSVFIFMNNISVLTDCSNAWSMIQHSIKCWLYQLTWIRHRIFVSDDVHYR